MGEESAPTGEADEDLTLMLAAETIVETIGPCTQDISNCEIMRTAIANKDAAPDNARAQALRTELAKVACQECAALYLSDVDKQA